MRFVLRASFALGVVFNAAPVRGQGRIVHDTIHSAALAANVVGDSPVREMLVYLPPSYGSHPRERYPVLYLIHGFTSAPAEWVDGTYDGLNLGAVMDSLIGTARGAFPEFIVVMPDGDNTFGGGFYTDSPVTGGWATYILHDVIQQIDRKYRTLPARAHRALAGLSMGGFGALALGSERPDLFGLVYAMSPCCAAFAGEFAPESGAWGVLDTAQSTTLAPSAGTAHLVRALAVVLSPDVAAPRRYGLLPVARGADGVLKTQAAVIARWQAEMPIGLVERFAKPGVPRPLLYLEYGTHDQVPSVIPGVLAVSQVLDRLKIPYSLETFDGGHVDRLRQRLSGHLLPAVGRWLKGTGR